VDVCLIFIETYSKYLDYYSLTLKVVITLTSRAKLTDVRATLDTSVEVSVIILNATICFKILITYSLRIALRTIISSKFRFISFINNILIIIRNLVV